MKILDPISGPARQLPGRPRRRGGKVPVTFDAERQIHFDKTAFGSALLVDPKPASPLSIALYTAPKNVDHVEVQAIGLRLTPVGVWHNMISWTFRVNTGAALEFISGSRFDTATPTARDAGFRWAPYGSLRRPHPTDLILRPEVTLQLAIVDYASVNPNPNVPVSLVARIVGVQRYKAA